MRRPIPCRRAHTCAHTRAHTLAHTHTEGCQQEPARCLICLCEGDFSAHTYGVAAPLQWPHLSQCREIPARSSEMKRCMGSQILAAEAQGGAAPSLRRGSRTCWCLRPWWSRLVQHFQHHPQLAQWHCRPCPSLPQELEESPPSVCCGGSGFLIRRYWALPGHTGEASLV